MNKIIPLAAALTLFLVSPQSSLAKHHNLADASVVTTTTTTTTTTTAPLQASVVHKQALPARVHIREVRLSHGNPPQDYKLKGLFMNNTNIIGP
jgi:hypothetical protein